MLRGGSDQEMTATSEVMDRARTFSGGWLGTAGVGGELKGLVRKVQDTPMRRWGPAAQPEELWVTQVGGPPDSTSRKSFGLVTGKSTQSPFLEIWVNRDPYSLVPGLWVARSWFWVNTGGRR